MNKCDKCPYLKDQFGNFVMCIKTSRFIDWEYWNNIEPDDCQLKKIGGLKMTNEILIKKYQARINLLNARDAEGNRGIVNKLKRKIRRLEK